MSAADTDRVDGQLRLSKGAWLFRPAALDVLLRVEPAPAPAREGFLARDVRARLAVSPTAVRRAPAPVSIAPRTGVPEEIAGVVCAREGDDLVVDAGIRVVVRGAARDGPAIGEPVVVDVDTAHGVRCVL